ncbi:MAG: TonB-dependent receptor [Pseudomonadota bacterium]
MADRRTSLRAKGRFVAAPGGLLLASAIASMTPAGPAWAAAADAAVTVNEVVVTAEKRETKLQDTPIAVTAFTPESIEKNRIEHLDDVALRTPNVTYTQFSNQESYFSIRGTLINNNAAGWDDAVATFIDDVPTTGLGDVNPNLFDLSSIEVLRGPQGTLFGRNATGGVVIIRTQPPSFEPAAKVEGTYGSDNLVELRGVFTGPLIADKLAAKLAVNLDHRDDYIRNVTLHDETAGVNEGDIRGQLLWDVNANLNVLFSADYLIDRSGGYPTRLTGNFIPALFPTLSYDPETTNQGINGSQHRDIAGLSARVTWNGRMGTLTSISGFRYVDGRFPNTVLGDPENQLPTIGLIHDRQFSQEVRWASPADKRLTWVTGVFALHSDKREGGPLTFNFFPGTIAQLFSPANNYTQTSDQQVATDSFAVFGEATYAIIDQLKLTVGARGTEERKAGTSAITYSRVDPNLFPGFATYSHSWGSFTPKVTLAFQPSAHLLFYATASEGFKSGGYDLSGSGGSSSEQVDQALATPFNPETVWNYEVGEKFTGFNNRFTLDADIFDDQYSHLQTSQLVIINSVPIPITSDAGGARVTGAEIEATALATDWLTLGLTYAYMDSHFTSPGTGFTGARIPYAPKNQIHASAEIHFPISGGVIALGGDYTYHTKVFFDNGNSAPQFLQQKSVWNGIINAYVNYTSPNQRWKLAVWAKNLTNEQPVLHAADVTVLFENLDEFLNNAGSVFLAKFYPQRTVGVTLTRNF